MKQPEEVVRQAWVTTVLFVMVLGVCLFLLAGTVSYWQGWVFWAAFTGPLVYLTGYFLRHDPELVERRLEAGPTAEQETSQQAIMALAGVVVLVLFGVVGWDLRNGGIQVPVGVSLVADGLVVVSFMITQATFRANTFASSVIEVEEGQEVISTGPDGIVRHLMYTAILLLILVTPLALGSYWAIGLIVPMTGVLAWRTVQEEKYLVEHLEGYAAYRKQVTARLVPGVW